MADPHPIVTYSAAGKFDDVREDLKLAIESKGLVIDYESYVNRMLERTGKDVGSSRKLYADAQAFVFCSAALSRKTMEADPANASFCLRRPQNFQPHATPSASWLMRRFASPPPKPGGIEREPRTSFSKACM